jgi:hypothetical protein
MNTPIVADVSPIDRDTFRILAEEEDKRHQAAIDHLRKRNREYQKICEHKREWNHYEPDPSGNNDSYYECRKCGKQW